MNSDIHHNQKTYAKNHRCCSGIFIEHVAVTPQE